MALQGYQDKETAFDIFFAGFSFGAAILSHLLHC
jgi:alpha/beta superfamily hydrolase